MITETWLKDSVCNQELGFGDFEIFRLDRNINNANRKKDGGGLLIAVRKCYPAELIEISINNLETLFVKCRYKGLEIVLNCTYIPCASPASTFTEYVNVLEEVYNSHSSSYFFINGDFNLPAWKMMSQDNGLTPQENVPTSEQIDILRTTMIEHEFCQKSNIPNSMGNNLDLVFTNIKSCTVTLGLDPILNIDPLHPSLDITIEIERKQSGPKRRVHEVIEEQFFCFKKANFESINSHFDQIDWTTLLGSVSLDTATELLYSEINNSIDKFIPKIKINSFNFPVWMSQELKDLILAKKIAHKNFKISNENDDYMAFSRLRQNCKNLSEDEYKSYVIKIESVIFKNK
uniref:Endonuclease/exonuclease/phosphatase domain-containing protein n=1 Tax=Cacopsylla melanoneura TaxID=428564 RepID=A0A8D8WXI6_9HEMI